jgi:isopentenyl-diphosphate Delta-isomerase
MEKLEAHRLGKLHRAVSVILFNPSGQMLLQKRAKGKYHSGGLWSNACCSHPMPGETTEQAASRRLKEEMGISTELRRFNTFIYRAEFGNGLSEHELDHLFVGTCVDTPKPDPEEAEDWKWMDMDALRASVKKEPEIYTVWFALIVSRFFGHTSTSATDHA